MSDMAYKKVERLIEVKYVLNSALIFVLILLSLTRYNSINLLRSLPYGGITSFWTIIIVYCYLFWWGGLAITFLIVAALYGKDSLTEIILARSSGGASSRIRQHRSRAE